MNHEEEDDIVSWWKTFFAKKNADKDGKAEAEGCEQSDDDNEEEIKCNELNITTDQYKVWCKPWMNSLIIKLLESLVPKQMLFDRAKRMWKPH